MKKLKFIKRKFLSLFRLWKTKSENKEELKKRIEKTMSDCLEERWDFKQNQADYEIKGVSKISGVEKIKIRIKKVALAFGVSSLVRGISGVAPATKASRLNPIDALRSE